MRDLPKDFKLIRDGGIGELIGREVIAFDAERQAVDMQFTLGEVFVNFQGVIHGGIIATLLDTVCGVVIRLSYNPDDYAGHVTLELKTSFFEASYPGVFRGEGRLKRLGRSVAFSEADLFNADGVKIAAASATFKLRRRKASS